MFRLELENTQQKSKLEAATAAASYSNNTFERESSVDSDYSMFFKFNYKVRFGALRPHFFL